MKKTLCSLALIFSTTTAFSVEVVLQKLMSEVNSKSVFAQVTNNIHCPTAISLVNSDYLPEESKTGDISIYLATEDGNNFTFEGNSFLYRPALKDGKNHKLFSKTEFMLGLVTRKASQLINNGVLTSEYKASVKTAVMIAKSHFIIKYDSNKNSISYYASGNEQAVNCRFEKVN